MLRGAIIGFGHIAANGHVPAYKRNPKTKIEAVFDSCPERKKVNDSLLPGSKFCTSIDELFDIKDIDFVDVSTPPAHHAKYIIEALRRKKHVLCEKPLVLTKEDLLAIWEEMEKGSCTVVTVHNWRYSPITQKISEICANSKIGKPKIIEYKVIRTRPSVAVGEKDAASNWRLDPNTAGGGILVDHGWHAFYLVNEWMGEEPVRVKCSLLNKKYHSIPVEDTASVEFEYPSGSISRLFFTWAGEKRYNEIKIKGEQGEVICLDDKIFVKNGKKQEEIPFKEGLSAGSHHPEWYDQVLDEFLMAINNDNFRKRNFLEAASCFNCLEHCKLSNKKGAAIEITPWKGRKN